jgi:probable rRNA maturation factor
MLDVEVFGENLAPEGLAEQDVVGLCALAAARRGVHDGHVAVEFVTAARIAELNARHRGTQAPTDVLSFPIDEAGALGAGALEQQRELGDVVICPAHTRDLREAVLHGMLHLLGMDHETDAGEMLALQDELLREAQR